MELDLSAPRAKKAKIAAQFSGKYTVKLLKYLPIILLIIALGLLAASYGIGWVIFAPAIWCAMIYAWYKDELDDLKPSGSDLSGSLDAEILGKINSKTPTGLELWRSTKNTPAAIFYAVRYGIAPDFFEQNLKESNIDIASVLSQATSYMHKYGLKKIDTACVFVALFSHTPGAENLMNFRKITLKELEDGIAWLAHLKHLIDTFSTKKNTGGIGRDWASGYTPILNQVAHNISLEVEKAGSMYRPIDSHRTIINQMLANLGRTGKTNVALVGEVGVGKTTAVYAMADALIQGQEPELRYYQVFSLDAATLLSNARQRGQLEELIFRIFNEAHHAGNVILFLDDAQLFFEDGTGSIDLSNLLLPLLQNTRIKIVFTMTPPQWQRLSAQNPALSGQMNYQLMPPTNEEETIKVLEDQVLFVEGRHKVTLTYYAIREAYKLSGQYISDEAYPGKAIKLLEQASVNAGKGSLLVEEHLQRTIETTKGVKVQKAGLEESSKLLHLEDELHKKMINQKSAVSAVSNALRRARAGARNSNRPIGAFLFLGPTGVGKTQLAKALAEVYFGSSTNIIRVDMNEYVNSTDINRLLAPETGSGTTFLGKIRQQPFSVVLLDEIEKAHQDIINSFLQLLDEGTISDTSGRQASFKDAIIIATSNAGADKIREYISSGKQQSEFEQEFIDGIISSGYFKPELINRFDELLVFRPLNESELLLVLDIMLKDVNRELDEQRVIVELDEEAKLWLVKKGNDPRLGARPLRRMVQKYVEDIVAKRVLEGSAGPGSKIQITRESLEAIE